MIVHLIPLFDELEHAEAHNCWCKPKPDDELGEALMTHHSADKREFVESLTSKSPKPWGVYQIES